MSQCVNIWVHGERARQLEGARAADLFAEKAPIGGSRSARDNSVPLLRFPRHQRRIRSCSQTEQSGGGVGGLGGEPAKFR